MFQLSLNFASPQRPLARPVRHLGPILLLVGAIMFAAVAWEYTDQVEINTALHAQRDLLTTRLQRDKPPQPVPAELSSQFDKATAAYAQILTPWDKLFHALETNRSADIALLSVSADAATKEFVLSGEARNFSALSKFSDTLSASPLFKRVALSNHRLTEGAQPIVLRFDLLLAWDKAGELHR